MPRVSHILGVNQPSDDHQRMGGFLHRAQIIDDTGRPVLSLNAVVARLRSCTSRADVMHVADVLAVIATTTPHESPPAEDRLAGLAEWDHAVAGHALADPTRPVAMNEHPTIAETHRIDSATASQRTIPGYLAAFATPPQAALSDPPARDGRLFTPQGEARGQPGHGIHR